MSSPDQVAAIVMPLAARVQPVAMPLDAATVELALDHLMVGILVAVLGIVVHAAATVALVSARQLIVDFSESTGRLRLMTVLSIVVVVMMAAHCLEIGMWALAYLYAGASADPADVFYFAFVNYTTLGYGDILPSPNARLLAPMTAGTGILMFGWTTAFMSQATIRFRATEDTEP